MEMRHPKNAIKIRRCTIINKQKFKKKKNYIKARGFINIKKLSLYILQL